MLYRPEFYKCQKKMVEVSVGIQIYICVHVQIYIYKYRDSLKNFFLFSYRKKIIFYFHRKTSIVKFYLILAEGRKILLFSLKGLSCMSLNNVRKFSVPSYIELHPKPQLKARSLCLPAKAQFIRQSRILHSSSARMNPHGPS